MTGVPGRLRQASVGRVVRPMKHLLTNHSPGLFSLALFFIGAALFADTAAPGAHGPGAASGRDSDVGEGPSATTGVMLRFAPPSRLTISRRADYSTYENGRYQGLASQEVVIDLEPAANTLVGRAIVFEQRRLGGTGLRRVDDSATIRLVPDGREVSRLAGDLPVAVVSAPLVMAEGVVQPGDSWSTRRPVAFAPFGEATTTIPVGVDYTYRGVEEYEGSPVHRVDAVYGLRFPTSDEPFEPGPLGRISGGHEVTILFHESGLYPVFLRDVFYESFVTHDGLQEEHRGFVVAWYRLKTSHASAVDLSDQPDVTVDEEGPALRVRVGALRFYPDEARLLPESRERVETIAERLRDTNPERYLVVGHTADVGNPKGQQTLSEERAQAVAEILQATGVPRDVIAYEGKGATEPVADNTSESGRAANRRVEIYVFRR